MVGAVAEMGQNWDGVGAGTGAEGAAGVTVSGVGHVAGCTVGGITVDAGEISDGRVADWVGTVNDSSKLNRRRIGECKVDAASGSGSRGGAAVADRVA